MPADLVDRREKERCVDPGQNGSEIAIGIVGLDGEPYTPQRRTTSGHPSISSRSHPRATGTNPPHTNKTTDPTNVPVQYSPLRIRNTQLRQTKTTPPSGGAVADAARRRRNSRFVVGSRFRSALRTPRARAPSGTRFAITIQFRRAFGTQQPARGLHSGSVHRPSPPLVYERQLWTNSHNAVGRNSYLSEKFRRTGTVLLETPRSVARDPRAHDQ